MEYGVNNNYELESRFPWQSEFVFVDSLPFRADAIFIRNELKVKFLEDMEDPNRPGYALVFCRVPRRDKALFLKSMADLDRAMLLEGNTDCREASREIIEMIKGLEQ